MSCYSPDNKSGPLLPSRSTRPIRLAADFAGMDMPSLAFRGLGVPFTTVYAAEADRRARNFLAANVPPLRLDCDVRGRDLASLPAVDGFFSGSPCPAFSSAGLRRGVDAPDGQGMLIWESVAAILEKRPSFFVLEQVRGFTTAHGGALFRQVLDALNGPGVYRVRWEILNTADHGVCHNRHRLYVVGILSDREATPFAFPAAVEPLALTDLLEPRCSDDDCSRLPPPAGALAQATASGPFSATFGGPGRCG